ncbi:hypothetical protein H4J59_01950 [Colwellia sp. MB02u-10]|uniref:hypothetical protein n=1 Tax=Colwellia sp. MB02u-10 TaxID=2759828 RepID=UPI0015F5E910|nr:hypothetical protein [Colwellia sp. MB02u-10]MBA6339778.1 hypothetical protein [Colwellia sp. MB02u-10]
MTNSLTERAFSWMLVCEVLGIKGSINPNGMRHWVAQSILAKESNNYRKAANALMDMVAIMMAIYGNNNHSPNESEPVDFLNLLSNLHEDI